MTVPDGYMENALGHLVPVEQVREMDKARDELVREKVAKVKAMQAQLRALKLELMGDISAFVQLSAERYGAKVGGGKGNITLMSYDGRYQIKRQVSETLCFDEGLQAAKALIDECLREWCEQSPGELRANVYAGSQYLMHQLQRFGSVELALAAYNAGPGSVEQYGGIPPFPETQEFVRRVLVYWNRNVPADQPTHS